MAITTGPEISLNDIHLEVGSATNTECSFNDEDIRALISAVAGSEMEITDWYGAENGISYLDEQTVTVGYKSLTGGKTSAAVWGTYYGYNTTTGLGSFGSINDGTFNVKSGASILRLYHRARANDAGLAEDTEQLVFEISGSHSNDGWDTMTIGTTDFDKDDATYSSDATATSWTWDEEGLANPFGTTTDVDVEVQFS